jgi:hypothetical protein
MTENKGSTIGSLQKTADRSDAKTLSPGMGEDAVGLTQQLPVDTPGTTLSTPYDDMRKSIWTWGLWLAGWAVFSVIDLNLPWAVVLGTVSLMSFYFYDISAMFLVYAGTLFWAAVMNLLVGGEAVWQIMGAIQVVFAVVTCREYVRCRAARVDHDDAPLSQAPSDRSFNGREAHMAWLSLLLGAIGLAGLCSVIPIGLILSGQVPDDQLSPIYTAMAITWELGVLAIPVGIAAFFAGHRLRAAAAAGIALGALSVLILIISISMVVGAYR